MARAVPPRAERGPHQRRAGGAPGGLSTGLVRPDPRGPDNDPDDPRRQMRSEDVGDPDRDAGDLWL